MIDTLNIGKYIYSTLTSDAELMKIVTKVYPIIADNDAKFPFVVYRRNGLTSIPVKQAIPSNYNLVQDTVHIELNIVSDKYANGLTATNRIRTLLQKDTVWNGYEITNVSIEAASEQYNGNAFIQTLQLSLEIN